MREPIKELRILYRKAFWPEMHGGSLRALNIAKLASEVFTDRTIFSGDDHLEFKGKIDGINIIQEISYNNFIEKFHYNISALTSRELIIPYSKQAFDDLTRSLIQIENPIFYPLLKKKKIYPFILDEQNVNWELYKYNPEKSVSEKIYERVAYHRDKENEKEALLNASHILTCSEHDKHVFLNEIPSLEDKISVIPNCVNFKDFKDLAKSFPEKLTDEKKIRVVFMGNLSYPPNTDAVRLICNVIAPQCGDDYQFIIIGKNPPFVHSPKNTKFLGYIADVKKEIYRADICIAPIRFGSGTRMKILEYLAMGKPVISTLKGAEGIEYSNGLNIIIEDKIEEYPEVLRNLVLDDRKCSLLSEQALKLIQNKYDWELYRTPLMKIYRKLIS